MIGHKYYNVLDDPTAHYSEPPPPRPSHKGIHSSKSFDIDPRYNNCTSPSPNNHLNHHSAHPEIMFEGGNQKPAIGSVVQLQFDISTRYLDNTRPVPSLPQNSYENSENLSIVTSSYENSLSHHRGSISSTASSSSSSSSTSSSKASYENDDAFALEGEVGKYSNVPLSSSTLVRKMASLTFSLIIIIDFREVFISNTLYLGQLYLE